MNQSSLRYSRTFSAIIIVGMTAAAAACGDKSSNTAPLVGTTVTINMGSVMTWLRHSRRSHRIGRPRSA